MRRLSSASVLLVVTAAVAGGQGTSGVMFPVDCTHADAEGVATFVLNAPGKWYVEFINMVASQQDGLDYHSKWATLTFAIR